MHDYISYGKVMDIAGPVEEKKTMYIDDQWSLLWYKIFGWMSAMMPLPVTEICVVAYY